MGMARADAGPRGQVLVADDDEGMRHFVVRALRKRGFEVREACDGDEAVAALEAAPVDVLVSDIRMPGVNGVELLGRLAALSPGARAVLMTAYGSIDSAVEAVKKGAESYLTKPFETDDLIAAVERAAERAALDGENRALRELLRRPGGYGGLLGSGKAMTTVFRAIDRAAAKDVPVLICGESGTGKELAARAVHARGPDPEAPFVPVACGALPKNLAGVEIFGAEKGAFTGAEKSRAGFLERADGGTIFLDEVEELPLEVQGPLLRYIEHREAFRVGGGDSRQLRVRIVSATSADLGALAQKREFRKELSYRLQVLTIAMPPLREHPEDLPLLLRSFLEEAGRGDLLVSPEVVARLQGLPWPGNVRELRNVAERLASLVEGEVVTLDDLPAELLEGDGPSASLRPYRQALEAFERGYLEDLLARSGGNVSEAARLGGLSRPSLHARISVLGIDTARFRGR